MTINEFLKLPKSDQTKFFATEECNTDEHVVINDNDQTLAMAYHATIGGIAVAYDGISQHPTEAAALHAAEEFQKHQQAKLYSRTS